MRIQIIPFRADLAHEFREMNLVWLNEYFYVEPKDKELLNRAEEVIIEQGGKIFFAQLEEDIAGCYSLLPYGNKSYELGKMAVKKQYQGKNIGHSLLEHAIHYAKQDEKDELILYSNTILKTAIHLYRKYGFAEIDMEDPPPYARSNIKMALKL